MPSLTDYTDNLKPYSPIGRSYLSNRASLPLLLICAVMFFSSAIKDEYNHYVDRRELAHAKTWPVAIAQIGDVTLTPVRAGGSGAHFRFLVKVEYKYTVNGHEHFSSQEKFLDRPYEIEPTLLWQPEILRYQEDERDTLTKQFVVGAQLPVNYNPTEPEIAYVDTDISEDTPADNIRRSSLFGFAFVALFFLALKSTGLTKMR